jgi:hypothetical protein
MQQNRTGMTWPAYTTRAAVAQAAERLERGILEAGLVEALLLRNSTGRSELQDARIVAELVDALAADQRPDGSWQGDVAATAETLLLLRRLGAAHEPAESALAWLRGRCRADGGYPVRCTPALHRAGLCPHFMPALPAVAPRSIRLGPLRLPLGQLLATDDAVRFRGGTLALAALLAWRHDDWRLREHCRALVRLQAVNPPQLAEIGGLGALASTTFALHHATVPGWRAAGQALAVALTRWQRPDASWPELPMLAAAEVILPPLERGRADALLLRSVRLVAEQLVVAGFGEPPDVQESSRMYLAWRVIVAALGDG